MREIDTGPSGSPSGSHKRLGKLPRQDLLTGPIWGKHTAGSTVKATSLAELAEPCSCRLLPMCFRFTHGHNDDMAK